MTDPTPTRAEVERYSPPFMFSTQRHGTMHLEASGQWVRFTDYQALRERAEAAERAQAAAWNDAIEAAEAAYAHGFAAILALRRAAPTEDQR